MALWARFRNDSDRYLFLNGYVFASILGLLDAPSNCLVSSRVYLRPLIVPVRCTIDFRELREGVVEFSEGSLETNLQRTDIDGFGAGRVATADAHNGVRDLRGCSAVIHVVSN
jgi:hypothetical protein